MDEVREDNRWLFKNPRTPEQMAECRKESVAEAAKAVKNPPTAFTCDECGIANVCTLAFDLYNTDGDCLYDK